MEVPEQSEKRILVVNVECEQKTLIQKQINIDISYLTFDRFLRKLLRNVHIPVKNQSNAIMKLEHLGLPLIITNDFDLQFIVRSQLLNNEPIKVSLSFTQQGQQTKQQIVFNEEGEKINEEFALNEPSDPRYVKKQKRGKSILKDKVNRASTFTAGVDQKDQDEEDQAIICAFCKESINDLEYIKKLGWFYGPFKHKKHDYYVHLMCAIWTPAVYLHEETNKMMNIKKEIQRSNKIMCKSCGLLGAGLGCKVINCKQSFHFKCALSDNIETRLDHQNYELYCPVHGHILDEKIEDEIENVHCEKCQIDENEDLILLCDNCDKAFHTYCLKNKLDSIPEGDWFCPECDDKNPRASLPPSLNNPNNSNHINSNKNLSRGFSFSKISMMENLDSQKSNKSKENQNTINQDQASQFTFLKKENSKNNFISQNAFQQISSQNNSNNQNVFSQSDNLWNALSPILQPNSTEKLNNDEQIPRKNVGLGDIFFN